MLACWTGGASPTLSDLLAEDPRAQDIFDVTCVHPFSLKKMFRAVRIWCLSSPPQVSRSCVTTQDAPQGATSTVYSMAQASKPPAKGRRGSQVSPQQEAIHRVQRGLPPKEVFANACARVTKLDWGVRPDVPSTSRSFEECQSAGSSAPCGRPDLIHEGLVCEEAGQCVSRKSSAHARGFGEGTDAFSFRRTRF